MTTIIEDSTSELGLRERKKQHTRTAIHEAALRLIDEQGLEATTIEQICQSADVSSRTFFNYYPSKAAAALQISATVIDPEVRERFLAAEGGLVAALCDAIGGSAELGPSHTTMKQLVIRRPELLTTMAQLMHEVRGTYVSLAEERATSREQAELAVTLVLAAMGRVMHVEVDSELSLAERLRNNVDLIVGVNGAALGPVVPAA
ncbi:MAG TPA: TetR/AcrR family transcriptional regulator [Galbitalea sp.]|jgi:AcrR family transcriptional regulator